MLMMFTGSKTQKQRASLNQEMSCVIMKVMEPRLNQKDRRLNHDSSIDVDILKDKSEIELTSSDAPDDGKNKRISRGLKHNSKL
jgi:hypothetical protein